LRGAGSEGHSRCAISDRMIRRSPDVTRILDRLVAAGLVSRSPGKTDRRTSMARITPRGRALLDRMDAPVRQRGSSLMDRLTASERSSLARLLEKLYAAGGE